VQKQAIKVLYWQFKNKKNSLL